MCELLWSDPCEEPGRSPNKRGVAIAFGPDVTHKFLNVWCIELRCKLMLDRIIT